MEAHTVKKQESMIRKHTADQPRHMEEEPQNIYSINTSVRQ